MNGVDILYRDRVALGLQNSSFQIDFFIPKEESANMEPQLNLKHNTSLACSDNLLQKSERG